MHGMTRRDKTIKRGWRADRVALAECRGRHAALAAWARGTVKTLKREKP